MTGRVQGVGVRPCIHRLATSHGLRGYVINLGDAGVEVVVEGIGSTPDGSPTATLRLTDGGELRDVPYQYLIPKFALLEWSTHISDWVLSSAKRIAEGLG